MLFFLLWGTELQKPEGSSKMDVNWSKWHWMVCMYAQWYNGTQTDADRPMLLFIKRVVLRVDDVMLWLITRARRQEWRWEHDVVQGARCIPLGSSIGFSPYWDYWEGVKVSLLKDWPGVPTMMSKLGYTVQIWASSPMEWDWLTTRGN
jgi:hypothetical protein